MLKAMASLKLGAFLLLSNALVGSEEGNLEGCLSHIFKLLRKNGTKNVLFAYEDGFDLKIRLPWLNVSYFTARVDIDQAEIVEHVDATLLTFSEFESIESYVTRTVVFLKADNVFVLVYCGDESEMFDIFKLFWYEGVHYSNVIVVIASTLKAYTFYPITRSNCSKIDPVFVGTCNQIRVLPHENEQPYFPGCVIDVLAQCQIPYVTNDTYQENTGYEVAIWRMLEQKLGFIPQLRCLDVYNFRGVERQNYIIGGKQMAAMCTLYYFSQERLAFFLREPESKAPYLNLLVVFQLNVWLYFSLMLLGLTLFYCIAFSKSEAFMLTWTILFNSVNREPTKFKAIFALWSFTAFILTNSYCCILITVLFRSLPGYKLSNMYQVLNSKFEYVTTVETFFDLIALDENEDFIHEFKRLNICESYDGNCYEKLKSGQNALITTKRSLAYFMKVWGKNGSFYETEPIYKAYNAFWSFCDEPFTRRIQQVLRLLGENGMIQHLDEDFSEIEEQPKFSKIELVHLYLIFGAYGVGLLLSLVVFLFERKKHIKISVHDYPM